MSMISIAERLGSLMACDDETCCCIPKRGTVVLISVINFLGCTLDLASTDTCSPVYCEKRLIVDSVRKLLATIFQMANIVLLLASVFENALLVDIYVWYTLGFIVLGFVVTIYEFTVSTKSDGFRSLIIFVPDVVFLFVIFRCLPLVDLYRKHLYSVSTSELSSN